MDLTGLKSHFIYPSGQRRGILVLLGLIVLVQVAGYYGDFKFVECENRVKQKWLALQSGIDSLKAEQRNYIPKVYPFNPNFISDYKGSKLGMSVAEIDRLTAFRKLDQYVNTAKEFQQVTQVSDSLLGTMSPYFKFPEWLKNRRTFKNYPNKVFEKKAEVVVLDINQATKEDLIKVYGIGEGLSDRILKEKEKLGGFVNMEQMGSIWGLSPEVIVQLKEHFMVRTIPAVKKIKINTATIKELMQFPYFKYALAKSIVTYRSMNGDIKSSEDLTKINGFPVEIVGIIGLYLEF